MDEIHYNLEFELKLFLNLKKMEDINSEHGFEIAKILQMFPANLQEALNSSKNSDYFPKELLKENVEV